MRLALCFGVVIGLSGAARADDDANAPPPGPVPANTMSPDPVAPPQPPPRPTPFDRGRFVLSAGGGAETTLDYHYIVIGASAGYFVLPGVEVELGALHQFATDTGAPSISELSPGLRYVAQPLVYKSPLVPYVGGFYRHWFVGGYPDVDTVGGRAGLMYVSRSNFVLGLGLVYEHTVSTCSQDCDTYYPDFTISLAL